MPRTYAGRKGETLNEHVYVALRNRISRGEWLPGSKLTLRGLATQLGTSVQPVRDAIGKLTAERALVLRPNASVALPPIDRKLMDEIFSMRTMLEGEATRRGTSRLTENDLNELERAIHVTRIHYTKGGGIQERVVAINQIAIILADRSGSEILSEQIVMLRTRTAPYYAAAMAMDEIQDSEFITFTTRIQDEFLLALRRRDSDDAEAIRRADLYTFQHYVYKMLKIE